MMLSYSMLLVDRQARSEHTTTSSATKSLGQALRVSLVKPGAYLSESYSGKKRDHTVKNVLLVNALLLILFLSDTYGGRTHDKPIADATPYPLPAGSRLMRALGLLAFTLPHVAILMPTKKPRGQELTWEQQLANQ